MRDPFSRNVLVAGKSKSKTPKHPPSLNRRVNMSKVKLDVVKPWVARRVTELLGIEDDVLVSMIFNVMEMDQIHKDGSVMYGQLLTFLERNTATFMTVRAHSRDAAAERAVDPKRRRSAFASAALLLRRDEQKDLTLFLLARRVVSPLSLPPGTVGSARERAGERPRRPASVHRRQGSGADASKGSRRGVAAAAGGGGGGENNRQARGRARGQKEPLGPRQGGQTRRRG